MVNVGLEVLILLASLAVLMKTSHWVIDSSVKIARLANLSEMVIGFLFIAVATSLPELAVSIAAIMSDAIGVSIGNVLGSNIADIALIVGVAAFFGPVAIKKKMLRDISTILFLTSMVLIVLLGMTFASQYIGVVLLAIFVVFVFFSVRRRAVVAVGAEGIPKKDHGIRARAMIRTIGFFALGMTGVLASSHFIVTSASNIALILGIAEAVIGASIIAVGTSLPELAVALAALKSKRWGLVLGDAMGSALTNLTLVLGFVLTVSPFAINISIFETLLLFLLLTNVVLWYFISSGRLVRMHGIILFFIYQIFLMSLFGVQLALL